MISGSAQQLEGRCNVLAESFAKSVLYTHTTTRIQNGITQNVPEVLAETIPPTVLPPQKVKSPTRGLGMYGLNNPINSTNPTVNTITAPSTVENVQKVDVITDFVSADRLKTEDYVPHGESRPDVFHFGREDRPQDTDFGSLIDNLAVPNFEQESREISKFEKLRKQSPDVLSSEGGLDFSGVGKSTSASTPAAITGAGSRKASPSKKLLLHRAKTANFVALD